MARPPRIRMEPQATTSSGWTCSIRAGRRLSRITSPLGASRLQPRAHSPTPTPTPTPSPTPTGPICTMVPTFTYEFTGQGNGSKKHEMTFHGAYTGAPAPASWSWTFGDSAPTPVRPSQRTTTIAGTYTVTLTIVNGTCHPPAASQQVRSAMTLARRRQGSGVVGRRRRRGQSLVEFALVLPIFLLVLFGLIDVGRYVYMNTMLSQAAREGARVASVEASWIGSTPTRAANAAGARFARPTSRRCRPT